jgi:uncharacterized cupredoxin-like copper-binding protein
VRALFAATIVVLVAAVATYEATARNAKTLVNVTEKEFTMKPSPASAKPGVVTFRVRNAGKLAHEFVVLKTNIAPGKLPVRGTKAREPGRLGKIPEFKPGKTRLLTRTLKAGKYVLLCNVPTHYKAGHFAGFRVG